MADEPVKYPKRKKSDKPPVRKNRSPNSGGGEGSDGDANWRGLGIFLISILLIIAASYLSNRGALALEEITYPKLASILREQKQTGVKKVESIFFVKEVGTGKSYLEGKALLPNPKTPNDPTPVLVPFRAPVDIEFHRDLQKFLADCGFPDVETRQTDNLLWQSFLGILPFLVVMIILYVFFRQQIKMAGKNAFSFGKSRARMMSKDKKKITFKDVAGIEEAKDELVEIVDFLKDPKKFQKLGGHIPKGVLMVGPPGTGKTLLAKAIAGEADVPFFSISGSDFVEMFVGVGASRVRDMFEQGRKSAPCLIFIDEIDAVGRSRGTGLGGGHDEREQTLNALLVEMDGIETQEGIIMIAATNRKDVLDPALLRPGRFDREVRVNLPDVKGREEILKVHAAKVKMDAGVDLSIVARGTPGFSGAELANLINEAALLAVRRGKEAITLPELEEARDKVRWGRERRSLAMSEEQKKVTAYHEAGHALLNVLLEHTDPIHKVSIIPRGPALGVTMMLPTEDRYGYERKRIIDDLCVFMGGRVAEEIFIGDISSGASGDIRQATWYARKMVCEWGMSDKLGMVHYGDDSSMNFLGRELGNSRNYSEAIAQEIDREVLDLTNAAYRRAKEMIVGNRDKTELIAQALLEYETLDGQHVIDLVREGKMNNPPPKSVTPPVTPLPSEALPPVPVEEKKDKGEGLLPGLQGVPA